MSRRAGCRLIGAVAFVVIAVLSAAMPAVATPPPQEPGVAPAVLQALRRDLGLTGEQAVSRLRRESAAAETERRVRDVLGAAFAGAWFDPAAGLVAGVSDPALVDAARVAGAVPRVVPRSLAALQQVQDALDGRAAQVPDSVTGWYVHPETNSVVVTVHRPTRDATTDAFIAGTPGAEALRVEEIDEAPRPLADLVGGEALYFSRGRCSIGFNATAALGAKRVITAGHCTNVGGAVAGFNLTPIGSVVASSFPNNDYGLVSVSSPDWNPTPTVSNYAGTRIVVTGSTEAPSGSSVCRSGSTTGFRCGTIQNRDQTVNYGSGNVVYGLAHTSVCGEPGDSGGSYLSGTEAQGVLSGGSGNCVIGGSSFFQPVNEVLSAHGLRLVTG